MGSKEVQPWQPSRVGARAEFTAGDANAGPRRVWWGEALRGQSSAARLIADRLFPGLGQFAAKLRDPSFRDPELASRRLRRFAIGKELGDAAVATFQRTEPDGEVEPDSGSIGGPGMAVFDQDLIPGLIFVVVVVEPFDVEALVPLYMWREDFAHVEAVSDAAAVFDLGNGISGENGGKARSSLPRRARATKATSAFAIVSWIKSWRSWPRMCLKAIFACVRICGIMARNLRCQRRRGPGAAVETIERNFQEIRGVSCRR